VDEGDRRGVDRLTIQEAARQLGVSEGAVRKRVTRGTLQHEKEDDGRVYVYLDARDRRGVDTGQDEGVDPNNNALMSQLRDEVAYLRDENRRKDEIIMQQAMTMRQLTAASSERPPDERESAETVEEEPEQRSGWLAPADKLPWWHYVLGLFLVFSGGFLAFTPHSIIPFDAPILLAIAWSPPGIFGFWVGYRKRNLRLWSQVLPVGALVGGVALLGVQRGIWENFSFVSFTDLDGFGLLISLAIVFFPAWLLFVSASLLGNTWQRRRIGRISGTTPASPASRTTQGAGQQPRKDLTPAQQAILGWGGAIISALITLVGIIMFGK
jgi:hypothetical protein